MRKLHLLMATLFTIFASSSGVIQTQAAVFIFSTDFETKTVSDFSNFKQSYYSNTYDLGATVTWNWSGQYSFASCPAPITLNVDWQSFWRLSGVGQLDLLTIPLPDMPCTTSLTSYSVERTASVSDQFVQAVIDDDSDFARINTAILFRQTGSTNGLRLRLHNYTTYVTLNYNFDTTYIFNYFLSDTQYFETTRFGTWTVDSDQVTRVEYVISTAGNDEYRIVNTNLGSVGTVRKKYAVNYNDEYFRGQSIGARIRTSNFTDLPFSFDEILLGGSGTTSVNHIWDYYYLNAANNQQAQVTVPQIAFTTEVCSGGFLDINVGCFFNNAMAWLVNDAPVVSSAFTLLNAGIVMAGQTFGIIGSFTQNNMFGVLILAGFGFIAVRWLIKND